MPTLSDLLTEVRDIIDEPIAAQFTDAMLTRWINEGARDLARATRHLKDSLTIPTVAGSGSYALPANVLAVEHCYFHDNGSGRRFPMTPQHLESIDQVRGMNWDREGTPTYYTTQGFSQNLTLTVFPTPILSTDEWVLLIARLPTDPISPSSNVDAPTAWYDALADYAEFKALRRDRDPRWQEAYQLYGEKRDGLVNNPDYHTANREMIPDGAAGYLPRWLVEMDY